MPLGTAVLTVTEAALRDGEAGALATLRDAVTKHALQCLDEAIEAANAGTN